MLVERNNLANHYYKNFIVLKKICKLQYQIKKFSSMFKLAFSFKKTISMSLKNMQNGLFPHSIETLFRIFDIFWLHQYVPEDTFKTLEQYQLLQVSKNKEWVNDKLEQHNLPPYLNLIKVLLISQQTMTGLKEFFSDGLQCVLVKNIILFI